MNNAAADLTTLIASWFWPFSRVAGMVAAAPIFGHRGVPARIKLGLALVLTMAIVPSVPPLPSIEVFSGAGVLLTIEQVIIGLIIGFGVRLVFVVFEVAGQQIAQSMDLGFASMVDPQNGIEVPVISHFYIVLATLVFLSLDGHLAVIEVLATSFISMPIGAGGLDREWFWMVSGQAGWVFSGAVIIALPSIVALVTVNLAFGVMTKAAPQLNIFAVGFPVTLVFGFFVMWFALPGVMATFPGLFEQGIGRVARLVSGGG